MLQKLNRIISMFPTYKKNFILSVLFVAFGIFSSPIIAMAAWNPFSNITDITKGLVGTFTNLPILIVAALVFSICYILWGCAWISSMFLTWVLSPSFTSLSYTNPATNPVIKAGFGITQGFTNMLLVIVLVYIALATILRLAGYETKKLLVTFIIVALLVNFAPVFCGLIVDASNIFMNFFLKTGVQTGGMLAKAEAPWKTFSAIFDPTVLFDPKQIFVAVLKLVMLSNFFLVATLIFALYTILFMVRYLAIWILVILSPIAFACYILPNTKQFFNMWWTQFLQWSIIGLTGAFFLRLADVLSTIAFSVQAAQNNEPWYAIGTMILPLMVPVVFMGLGLIYAVQTSAMGASAVMGLTQRGGKWVGKKAGGRIWKHVEDKARLKRGVGRTVNAIDKSRMGKAIRWAIPDKMRKYGEYRPAIDEFKKTIGQESSRSLADGLANGRFVGEENAAVIDLLARERGDGEDIIQGYARKHRIDTKKDPEGYNKVFERIKDDKYLKKGLLTAGLAGMQGKILRFEPRLARVGTKTPDEATRALREVVDNIKPGEVAAQEREVKFDDEFMEMFLTVKGEEAIRALGQQKGGVLEAQGRINKIYSDWVDKNHLDSKTTGSWDKYLEHTKRKYNIIGKTGFEKALTNNRMISAGWEQGKYVQPGTPAAPPIPGGAAGMPMTPPSTEEVSERLRAAKERGENERGRRAGGRSGAAQGRRPGGNEGGTGAQGRRPGG